MDIISLTVTTKQYKMLKKIYGDQSLSALCQLWFNEFIEIKVDKLFIDKQSTKTLNQKIDEIIK